MAVVLACLLVALPLCAQSSGRKPTGLPAGVLLSGRVLRGEATPAPYAGVELVEAHQRRLAGADGSFSFKVAPGTYHIRIRQLGFAPSDTVVRIAAGSATPVLVIRMVARSIQLGRVIVKDPERCTKPGVDSLDEPVLYGILSAVRENASRELLLRRSYPFEYAAETVLDTAASDSAGFHAPAVPSVTDTLYYRSDSMPPYARGQIVFVDLTDWRGARERMRLPATVDFANDAFVATHCFDYRSEESGEYALNFRPLATLDAPDVEGRVTLDSLTYVVRRAVFRLTRPELVARGFQRLEVRTTYREVIPRIAVAAEITAVQMFRGEPPDSISHRVTEHQTTRSFRFLGEAPPGIPTELQFTGPDQRAAGMGRSQAMSPAQ